jgi:hypothetical protein
VHVHTTLHMLLLPTTLCFRVWASWVCTCTSMRQPRNSQEEVLHGFT